MQLGVGDAERENAMRLCDRDTAHFDEGRLSINPRPPVMANGATVPGQFQISSHTAALTI